MLGNCNSMQNHLYYQYSRIKMNCTSAHTPLVSNFKECFYVTSKILHNPIVLNDLLVYFHSSRMISRTLGPIQARKT